MRILGLELNQKDRNLIFQLEKFYLNVEPLRPEIGGHACPRLVRPVSLSAIFLKNHVRVRVHVRGLKNFHVRVGVRVSGLKNFHVRVRVRDFKISHVRVCDFPWP